MRREGCSRPPAARYCTSDHKRTQIDKVFTLLGRRSRAAGAGRARILSCMGLRADESPARARRPAFAFDERASTGRRHVDVWLPIHGWNVRQVWERIRASGVPHHPAYDLGMPRLSCCFCIFSPRSALLLAGKHNPGLLAEYVRVERKIGHSFRYGLPLAQIQRALDEGEEPGRVHDWTM